MTASAARYPSATYPYANATAASSSDQSHCVDALTGPILHNPTVVAAPRRSDEGGPGDRLDHFSRIRTVAERQATEATHIPHTGLWSDRTASDIRKLRGNDVRDMTPMQPTTLRFPDSLWQLVQEEAKLEGLSASEFIRQSLLATVLIRRASADPQVGLNWERAFREARDIMWGNGDGS